MRFLIRYLTSFSLFAALFRAFKLFGQSRGAKKDWKLLALWVICFLNIALSFADARAKRKESFATSHTEPLVTDEKF